MSITSTSGPSSSLQHIEPLPNYVNLSDPVVLRPYLKENISDRVVTFATNLIKTSSIRPIDNRDYGMAFPINHEVLAYTMPKVKDEVVVEIAGAGGENSILLACAGAKKVYMNDILPSEVQKFNALRGTLPLEVQDRLVPAPGDCFDLLKNKPELKNQVGLVVCRNLIHFFTDEQQAKLIREVKEMLKPGGQAIFTANSTYALFGGGGGRIVAEDPNVNSFNVTQCVISHPTVGNGISLIYRTIVPSPEHLMAISCEEKYLYRRIAGKWTVDNEAFNKIEAEMRGPIKDAIKTNPAMKNKTSTAVRVVTCPARAYNTDTVQTPFKDAQFKIEHTYTVGPDGHLVRVEDRFTRGVHVGVIIKAPLNQIGDK